MRARVEANLAALRLVKQLQAKQRPAVAGEQLVLARWSGWGAAPAIFDDSREEFAAERAELRQLLSETEWRAAARTTLNAHYTDTGLARAIWAVLEEHGFAGTGGRVLEPGCGAGVFLGLAPTRRGSWWGWSWIRPPRRSRPGIGPVHGFEVRLRGLPADAAVRVGAARVGREPLILKR